MAKRKKPPAITVLPVTPSASSDFIIGTLVDALAFAREQKVTGVAFALIGPQRARYADFALEGNVRSDTLVAHLEHITHQVELAG